MLEPADTDGAEPNGALQVLELPTRPAVFECPECHLQEPTPEGLGVHIERHREVLPEAFSRRGRPLTFPCPKGCGRHFPRTGSDARHHIGMCDGQPPLLAARPAIQERKEAVVAKLKCGKCGKPYSHQKRLDTHEKGCAGEAGAARRPRRAAAPEPESPGAREPLVVPDTAGGEVRPIKDRILDQLDLEEERLAKELGSVKALIAAVRESGGGG